MGKIKHKYKDVVKIKPNIICKKGRYKTDIECLMSESLKKNKIEFVNEYPIRSKYNYILDFAIPDLKIDIETDGERWHKLGNDHDRKRNWVLRNKGWKIIRFRGKEIKNNMEECIVKIKTIINERGLVSHED